MMESLGELAEVYSRIGVYERITRDFDPHCCVLACQVTKAVFRYFGCDVLTVPTRCGIFNRQYIEYLDSRDRPATDEEAEAWAEAGCYSVLMAHPASKGTPNKLGVHLINIVQWRGEQVGIDPSIQQAHRPQREIVLERPLVFSPACELLETGTQTVIREDGIAIAYQQYTDGSYLTSPDWISDRRWKGIAGETIRKMKEYLSNGIERTSNLRSSGIA